MGGPTSAVTMNVRVGSMRLDLIEKLVRSCDYRFLELSASAVEGVR